MKKLIIALLIGVLASNIPAAGMEKDNQSHQQSKDYLCTHRISVRQWHAEKAAKKVAATENKLNKELNISTPDPKFMEYSKETIEYHKKGSKELPAELELELKKRLKQLGCSDIPDIAECPEMKHEMRYHSALDKIQVHPYIRILFENGLKEEALKEFTRFVFHLTAQRDMKHGLIYDRYRNIAEQTNKQDVASTTLIELRKAQMNQADVLGCLKLGPHLGHMLRDGFKQRTFSNNNNFKLTIPSAEDDDGGNTHPSTQKRIKKFNTIIHDMKEEDKGRSFNQYYKTNGLPRFIDWQRM